MNDTDWFTPMYRRHHDDVERYVRQRVPDVEIADVVATVFMTAWWRIGDLPRTAPLLRLYTVTNKTVANEVRSRRRQWFLDRPAAAAPAGRCWAAAFAGLLIVFTHPGDPVGGLLVMSCRVAIGPMAARRLLVVWSSAG